MNQIKQKIKEIGLSQREISLRLDKNPSYLAWVFRAGLSTAKQAELLEQLGIVGDGGTVQIDDEIWFVASEICKLLDIQNVTQAVSSLDDDEKLPYVLHRSGQNRNVILISESGLYALVFKSKKPSAK